MTHRLHEERIGGEHERLRAVGLHAEEGKVALHGALADVGVVSNGAHAPVRARLRLRRQYGAKERGRAVIIMRPGQATGRRLGEPGQPNWWNCRRRWPTDCTVSPERSAMAVFVSPAAERKMILTRRTTL